MTIPTVTFGGVAATVVSATKTQIVCTVPAHAAGAVDVVVTNNQGASATSAGAYTYIAPPVLLSIDPDFGLDTGGTSVTLTGTGFRAGASVTFGGTSATSVVVVNSTTITCDTPAHASGLVDVVVTNDDAQSSTLEGGFTYYTAGLVGQYYDDTTWTHMVATRVDAQINWPNPQGGSIHPSLPSADFTCRWTGYLVPLYSETYTFTLGHDNGGKLIVNGTTLVNTYASFGYQETSGVIALTAGVPVSLQVELDDEGVSWAIILKWQSASQALEVVPASRLFH